MAEHSETNLLELTKALVDIPSVTGNEGACGRFLQQQLLSLGFAVETQPVSEGRCNIFARRGTPKVVLSTHMDTVPPFFGAREDGEFIYGRGACDAKGILAAQVIAAKRLLDDGFDNLGLLFLVGEETISDGARAANLVSRGSEYIINGEPTENQLVIGTKGMLWFRIETQGRAAHSAYPEMGESAIERLLDILQEVRSLPLPHDPLFGAASMNIGLISGGRAANVIPDRASADILYRTVPEPAGSAGLRNRLEGVLANRCTVELVRESPFLRLEAVEGFETRVVSFGTDLPALTNWGRPLLIGPGSIDEAHTADEKVAKSDLVEAVRMYGRLARELLARS